MKLDINVNLHLVADGALVGLLTNFKESIVSALSDSIAAATASQKKETDALAAAVARVQADLNARTAADKVLTDKIAELQALVDAGGATQADLDALAALQAQQDANAEILAALDPTDPTVLP